MNAMYDDYRKMCKDRGVRPIPKVIFKRIAGLIPVTLLHWRDKTIQLDGYHFHNCRFYNCKLLFKSTNYKLDHCHIGRNCTIERAT